MKARTEDVRAFIIVTSRPPVRAKMEKYAMSTSILIAHQMPLARRGLQDLVKQDPTFTLIEVVATTPQLLALANEQQPEIVLIDGKLADALQAVEYLQKQGVEILVFAVSDKEDDFFRFFRAGARAYVDTLIDQESLLDLLHRLARHECVMSFEQQQTMTQVEPEPDVLEEENPLPVVTRDAVLLSPREAEILRYIAAGYSNKEIARVISISDQTIKNHITRILLKFDVRDRTAAVVRALREGTIAFDTLPSFRPELPRSATSAVVAPSLRAG